MSAPQCDQCGLSEALEKLCFNGHEHTETQYEPSGCSRACTLTFWRHLAYSEMKCTDIVSLYTSIAPNAWFVKE